MIQMAWPSSTCGQPWSFPHQHVKGTEKQKPWVKRHKRRKTRGWCGSTRSVLHGDTRDALDCLQLQCFPARLQTHSNWIHAHDTTGHRWVSRAAPVHFLPRSVSGNPSLLWSASTNAFVKLRRWYQLEPVWKPVCNPFQKTL